MNFTSGVVACLHQPCGAACVPPGLSPEVAHRVGCAVQVGVKDDQQVPEHLSSLPRQRQVRVLRSAGGKRAGEEDEQRRQACWKENCTVSLVEVEVLMLFGENGVEERLCNNLVQVEEEPAWCREEEGRLETQFCPR